MPRLAQKRINRVHIAYAGAHYGKSLFWYMSELLFGFYLAEIYQIAPTTLGMLLFVFLVWDAITDPAIAIFLWRRATSTDVLMKYQAGGAMLCAITFVLIFFKPALSEVGMTIYALGAGLAFRTAYTIFDVPQNALLQRLSLSDEHRVFLASSRAALSALATLTVSFATVMVLRADAISDLAWGYALVAAAFSLIATATSLILMAFGRGWNADEEAIDVADPVGLLATLSDPVLLHMYAVGFLLALGWPLFGKLLPFFATYVLLDPSVTGILIATIAVSNLLSQPVWAAVASRLPRDHTAMLFGALTVLACAGFWNFGPQGGVETILAMAMMAATTSAIGMLSWTMFADRLAKAKRANDVFAFGVFTCFAKLGLGCGGLMLGMSLDMMNYVPGKQLDAVQRDVLIGVMVVVPAVCSVFSAGLMMRVVSNRLSLE